jgi:hypothetical protein
MYVCTLVGDVKDSKTACESRFVLPKCPDNIAFKSKEDFLI